MGSIEQGRKDLPAPVHQPGGDEKFVGMILVKLGVGLGQASRALGHNESSKGNSGGWICPVTMSTSAWIVAGLNRALVWFLENGAMPLRNSSMDQLTFETVSHGKFAPAIPIPSNCNCTPVDWLLPLAR